MQTTQNPQMKHFTTISGRTLTQGIQEGGCGECKTSCQSACKTSATVANQVCAAGGRNKPDIKTLLQGVGK